MKLKLGEWSIYIDDDECENEVIRYKVALMGRISTKS